MCIDSSMPNPHQRDYLDRCVACHVDLQTVYTDYRDYEYFDEYCYECYYELHPEEMEDLFEEDSVVPNTMVA